MNKSLCWSPQYNFNSGVPKQKFDLKKCLQNNVGFLFILPWLIGFCVFKLYPFAASLYYSFSDFTIIGGASEYGLFNYEKVFTDKTILKSLIITFKYAFITVPLKLIAALFIAYILNFKIKGVNLFRTAYYIPSILGGSIAIAVLWTALFKDTGLINTALSFIGIKGPHWLSDPNYALVVICLLRVWQFGSSMVIFLAALKNVPADLYEAASLDGAGKWRQFFTITVPLITPMIFFNFITQLCQAFQEFNAPYMVTRGGPQGATNLTALMIYNSAFKNDDMALASAMAWVMFIVLVILTTISFVSQKYWVYYSDEDGR